MFRNEHKTVIYNTLNSAYLVCPNDAVVEQILEQWENAGNGYGAVLAEKDLENRVVKDFVNTVRESFAGDCVEYDSERPKPYLFKPDLFLNTDIRIKQEKEKTSLGVRILQNLHEVTVYLPASCSRNCTACTSYCKQFNHCTICREGILNQTDYTRLLHQFHTCGIQHVNLSGGRRST